VTNSNTFENILKWYKQIKEITERPLIIVGNKADKEDLVVTDEDMSLLAEKC
jgi:GTPase SAR1 family protein